MRLLRSAGWILLSVLLTFALYSVVQWLSYDILDLFMIVNSILLFSVFTIQGLFIKPPYTLIGPVVFSLFLFIMLLSDNAFHFDHIIIFLLIFAGCLTGVFLRKKQYKSVLASSLAAVVFLFWLGAYYFPRVEVIIPQGVNITPMIKNSDFLISRQGQHPEFGADTVYLVNFTLVNCLPCRRKDLQLKKIARHFANKPFKIVEVHILEPASVFRKSDFPGQPSYHDSLNTLAKIYKISGGPEEIIFDKNGKAVRKFAGYSKEQNSTYYSTTIHDINLLLNEQ